MSQLNTMKVCAKPGRPMRNQRPVVVRGCADVIESATNGGVIRISAKLSGSHVVVLAIGNAPDTDFTGQRIHLHSISNAAQNGYIGVTSLQFSKAGAPLRDVLDNHARQRSGVLQ